MSPIDAISVPYEIDLTNSQEDEDLVILRSNQNLKFLQIPMLDSDKKSYCHTSIIIIVHMYL